MATKKVNKKTIQAKKQKKKNKQQKKSRGFYDHSVIQKIIQEFHLNKNSIDGFIHKIEQIDTKQFIKIFSKMSNIDEAELIASGIAEEIQEIGWQTYLVEFNKEVNGIDFLFFKYVLLEYIEEKNEELMLEMERTAQAYGLERNEFYEICKYSKSNDIDVLKEISKRSGLSIYELLKRTPDCESDEVDYELYAKVASAINISPDELIETMYMKNNFQDVMDSLVKKTGLSEKEILNRVKYYKEK